MSTVPPLASPAATALPAPSLLQADLAEFTARFGSSTALTVGGLDGGPLSSVGALESPYAWSTIKVVIAARTVLDAGGVASLPGDVRRDIEVSLTRSDNVAAARLWQRLVNRTGSMEAAAASLEQVLRAGGDARTRVSSVGRGGFSPYGQTLWSLEDQVRFFAHLVAGCVLPSSDSDWLVARMGEVVPDQRWGLLRESGAVGKGGWGPDPDGVYLVRQVAVLPAPRGGRYVVAVATRAAGADFRGGTRVLDDVLEWLQPRVREAPTRSTCEPVP